MPTVLGKKYSIDWAGDPAHMLKTDIPIWQRFREKWAFQFAGIYYDCFLGGPYYTEKELKDPMVRMWRANMAKRADAIAELKDEVWIIEVSASPGLRALGQLQTYRTLWLDDPKIMLPEKAVLVCEEIEPDLARAAGMYGILVYVVKE